MVVNSVTKRRLSDCKILIVDDQSSSRLVLSTLLEDIVACDAVKSGQEAIDYCANYRPDLILMDVVMPEMDGHETTKILASNPDTATIPFMFVTSSNADDEQAKCWASGCVDFIEKPINACTVRNRVKSYLQHKLKSDFLERLIYIDRLTCVYNRHYLEDHLPNIIKDGTRNNTATSLILFDVDYFKKYNDHYGHLEGDNCLFKICQNVSKYLLRPMDCIVRVGGEEFLVILPNTDESGARQVANRLLGCVNELHINHSDSEFKHVTISAGVSTKLGNENKSIDYLMLEADRNLYVAKNAGRNRVVCRDGKISSASAEISFA
ncbi:diguanylate cyclase [Alteromonas sp. 345S023]|uniref:diguanylate cyclase n=1 Tax=Alteromonas profundi TaxID=2696062 RepID=A0A7X5LMW1_9ALTE|nr:diguanylate cyclase [Alteromonas profundi]NDV92306.1 diguanylate cyclase [Alteromonas profundi]